MITIKETSGDTLHGAIDGLNRTYVSSYEFYDAGTVNIYVNGRLKIRDWDDGFVVSMPNVVILNEPLLAGDSLEVEYKSGSRTGGGADGGCPSKPSIVDNTPEATAHQDVPGLLSGENVPSMSGCGLDTKIISYDLKPTVISVSEE